LEPSLATSRGRLFGRVAVITGATRGIGRATAELFAEEGASIGINFAHDEAAAEATVQVVRARGAARAISLKANVLDTDQMKHAAARCVAELGPVDTLVLNAPVARFEPTAFVDATWSVYYDQVVGELEAAYIACHAFVPGMIARGTGCVIGISSALARRPAAGFSPIAAAKGALESYLRALATELASSGVRFNIVEAGMTETDATSHLPHAVKEAVARMTPLGRIAQPIDIAGSVLFLASNEARFVTGATLPVSGGMVMF
jgi:3-oxoacyl-[acyl-carrier protein] reductase